MATFEVEWDKSFFGDPWQLTLRAKVSLPLISFPIYPNCFVLKTCDPWLNPWHSGGAWNQCHRMWHREVRDSTVDYSGSMWAQFETDEDTRHFFEADRRHWRGRNQMLYNLAEGQEVNFFLAPQWGSHLGVCS